MAPRFAIMAPPGPHYVAATWASWLSGGIAVPLCLTHPPGWAKQAPDCMTPAVNRLFTVTSASDCAVVLDHAGPAVQGLCFHAGSYSMSSRMRKCQRC